MLRIALISLSLLLVTPGLINGENTYFLCKGEIKDGKLKITENAEEGTDSTTRAPNVSKIPEDCTWLEIHPENGTEVNWETVEKVDLPQLKVFKLHLTFEDPDARKEFEFKRISLFGNEPKEVERLGIDTYLYINGNQLFNYDGPLKYLSISSINTNAILKAFEGQGIKLTSLILDDPIFNDVDFTGFDGATSLTLKNVQSGNISALIQKFKSVEDLSLSNVNETIDISRILSFEKLNSLDITGATLTYTEANAVQSETLKTLTLTECTQDESFKENAWKIMPNLTTFRYSAQGQEKVNLKDFLVHKQLTEISLTNGILSFTKPTEQYKTLETLRLETCEIELTNFAEVVSSTFPNMTSLTVDATSGGTKPTAEFLNDILSKLPEILRISLDPFDLSPSKEKGTFEIIYRYNPPYVE